MSNIIDNEKQRKDSTVEIMTRITEQILKFTIDCGSFGMNVVDQFHDRMPETTCDMCGECCFSISFYSIEYHRIIRHLMETCNAGQLRIIFYKALNSEDRLVTTNNVQRTRCLFLDDNNKCTIHQVRPFPCRLFGQEWNGVQECDRVKAARPLPDGYYETLLLKLADNSEQFVIPKTAQPVSEHLVTPDTEQLDNKVTNSPFANLQTGYEGLIIPETSQRSPESAPVCDFFPFEFWVRRALSGKEEAMKWFVTTHYYKKFLSSLAGITF